MTVGTKAWMNRFLRQGEFVVVGVIATHVHRFIAYVDFNDREGNTLRSVSTAVSESPEEALEALWHMVR